MRSWIRRRLTFANVAMTLALVLAMSGGAYAASRYVITSTKQIKPSVLRQLHGKRGARGNTGAQGSSGKEGPAGKSGPAGAPGIEGLEGAKGKNGAPGAPGQNGISVAETEVPTGDSTCEELGGVELKSAEGKVTICNGKPGQTGFTKTLPSGEAETGTWVVEGVSAKAGEFKRTSISFDIPISPRPELTFVTAEEPTPQGCKGSAEQPEAEAGKLCIFEAKETLYKGGLKLGTTLHPGGFGPGTYGVELLFQTTVPTQEEIEKAETEGTELAPVPVTAEGTWAATAG